MGIDVIKLGKDNQPTVESTARAEDFCLPQFQLHEVPDTRMNIWFMSTPPQRMVFPSWNYDFQLDSDFQALSDMYSISSPQALFDSLILSQIKKMGGSDLYAVFPGKIKTEGWGQLKDIDKETFQRGHECNYHLDAEMQKSLTVNWVPFYKPQSLVKSPNFGSLWRLFEAGKNADSTNCLCLFSLSDIRKLPQVLALLIEQTDNRSEKMLSLVDWYGVYSSPNDPAYGSCLPIYTGKEEVLFQLESLKQNITNIISKVQNDLISDPRPSSVIRSLSRHIVL